MIPTPGSLLDRIDAARKEREAMLAAQRRTPVTAEARLGLPYEPGDRVFDVKSGLHGHVSRVDPAPRGGEPAVIVTLDTDVDVTRAPGDLIDRPSER